MFGKKKEEEKKEEEISEHNNDELPLNMSERDENEAKENVGPVNVGRKRTRECQDNRKVEGGHVKK